MDKAVNCINQQYYSPQHQQTIKEAFRRSVLFILSSQYL